MLASTEVCMHVRLGVAHLNTDFELLPLWQRSTARRPPCWSP